MLSLPMLLDHRCLLYVDLDKADTLWHGSGKLVGQFPSDQHALRADALGFMKIKPTFLHPIKTGDP